MCLTDTLMDGNNSAYLNSSTFFFSLSLSQERPPSLGKKNHVLSLYTHHTITCMMYVYIHTYHIYSKNDLSDLSE